MKITKIALPNDGEFHFYFVVSDWHSDHMNPKCYSILKQHMKIIPKECRRLVILGDFLDCVHLMGKKTDFKNMCKNTDTLEYVAELSELEFEWGNQVLDEMQELVDHIYFVSGNHDWRYDNFKDNWAPPAYAHNFDLKRNLKLEERGIPFVDYNDWIDIGNLSLTHGMFHGGTHLKKHYEACGNSVMYGHVHHADSKSFFFRGVTKKAWSLPCMCDLNPCYIKNRDSNWSNGYATVGMKPNGNFNVHINEIIDNELILADGTVIDA